MNNDMYKLLRFFTYSTYNELFEVMDIDMKFKPAITTKLIKVNPSPKGDRNFNKELWSVEIDWRLLDRYKQGGKNETNQDA